MSHTLKFEHPQFPEGYKFGLNDLGVVENGGTLELSEDQERLFVAARGMTVADSFEGSEIVEVSGSSALSDEEVATLLPPVVEEEETETVVELPVVDAPPNETDETGGDN